MTSFKPYFSKSIDGVAGQNFYIEPSSSIGPIQMASVLNELEWNYHFINSQTRINLNINIGTNNYPLLVITSSDAPNTNYLLRTYGPFRLNLDKNGQPSPIVLSFVPNFYTVPSTMSVTGTYTAILRPIDVNGIRSNVEVGTFLSYSYNTLVSEDVLRWRSFNTPSASYISSSMRTNSSIIRTTMNIPQQLMTRTTKSLSIPDAFQNACMAYLDIYFQTNNVTGSGNTYVTLQGLYGREVNVYGAIAQ